MILFRDIGNIIRSLVRSFAFVFRHNLWYYFFFPIALLAILFFGGKLIFEEYLLKFDFTTIQQSQYIELIQEKGNYDFLIAGVELITIFVIVNYSPYIVLLIMVPFQTLLSAKTDKIITGFKRKMTLKQYYSDIATASRIILRNLFLNLIYVAIWLLLSTITRLLFHIPEMTYADTIVIYTIGFYFYGFSLIDYTTERRGLSLENRIRFPWKHIGITFIIGAFYSLAFLLPYGTGVIISTVIATIASTMATLKVFETDPLFSQSPDFKQP
ncbi:MAG: hypothetical protein CVU05_13190 [Bacteroidetes bacterium HGW-Bacteroidetes-21]|jgi:CysZ protein|nr:MAG: hypothetical protein CVU05_13190 [Bacteroidetes bacterium HGW-Bacteroidetes-21]